MYIDFSAVFSATRRCNLSAFKLADLPLGLKKKQLQVYQKLA